MIPLAPGSIVPSGGAVVEPTNGGLQAPEGGPLSGLGGGGDLLSLLLLMKLLGIVPEGGMPGPLLPEGSGPLTVGSGPFARLAPGPPTPVGGI